MSWLFLFWAPLWAAQPLPAPTPTAIPWVVQEGKAAGPLTLSQPADPVLLTQMGEQKAGEYPGSLFFPQVGLRLDTVPGAGTLEQIEMQAPFSARTANGLGIGSRAADLQKIYGPAVVIEDSDAPLWLYEGRGIGFRLHDGVVKKMALFTSGRIGFPGAYNSSKSRDLKPLPGTGIENLLFGTATSNDFLSRFGSPEEIDRGVKSTAYIYRNLGFIAAFKTQGNEFQSLLLTAPFQGKVYGRVGIGSELTDIWQRLPKRPVDYRRLRYTDRGIDFYLENRKIMMILLYSNMMSP